MARLQIWAVVLGMVGAAGAMGCDSGETSNTGEGGSGGTSGTGGTGGTGGAGGGVVCPDDPAEGPVPEECGTWVSAAVRALSRDSTLRATLTACVLCASPAPPSLPSTYSVTSQRFALSMLHATLRTVRQAVSPISCFAFKRVGPARPKVPSD